VFFGLATAAQVSLIILYHTIIAKFLPRGVQETHTEIFSSKASQGHCVAADLHKNHEYMIITVVDL